MPDQMPPFEIDDAASFDANLETFFTALTAADPALAAVLKAKLPALLKDEAGRGDTLDALLVAAEASETS